LQKTVRTWMGNDPRGGSPAVIDVWAGRDVGFLDATTKAWLTKKFGADAVKALEVDSEGAYTGEQYEHAAEFYNDLAKWLNERGEDGGDWKAHQVQAVGWIAIQKMMSGATEYPSDIINKNTRPVFIELEFGVGSPLRKQFGSLSTLPDSVAENITRDVLGKMAAEAARITGARVLGTAYGPGGYKGEVAPSGHFSVFGSPETIADFADVMGYLAQQTEIWTARPLKSGGSTAVDIYADASDTNGAIAFTDPGKMKAFANDLQRSISGFEVFSQ
jgi:hypothetical protein